MSQGKQRFLDFNDPEDQKPQPSRLPIRRALRILAICSAVYTIYSLSAGLGTGCTDSQAIGAFSQHPGAPKSREQTERLFISVPDAGRARAVSRKYSTRPHVAGSPGDFQAASDLLRLFQDELGIPPPSEPPVFSAGSLASRSATLGIEKLDKPNAWIDTYYPLMNTPLSRSLSILEEDGTVAWEASLEEEADPRDPDAYKHKDAVPTFHGFSADGEVQGRLIYTNYGLKSDYDEVLAAGGNFTGKIVLTRYGANFRGLKVQAAEQLGAAGVLMYSDPRDDGPVTVENGYEAYPAGPARNPTSVQRGSVQYLSLYPGDPTTPGTPAYPNATRTEGENIPKIPSLPISWLDAQKLLKEISGHSLDDAFKLDGKTSARDVKLVNHVHNRIMPIWNTMGVIPGHIHNETVIIGNHRDAWVMGAVDPTSGTVTLHEIVRGFGALVRQGWRPLRNIVFASWDAEEYGLIGSTEWAEDFPDWIAKTVVAYINVDGSAAGAHWVPTGSPSLAHLIRDTALEIPHPTSPNKTLWDARNDMRPFQGPADREFVEEYLARRVAKQGELGIEPLGSGSDFTPFLQRLGVASMDETFNLSPTDAAYHYHSIYDSESWKEKYADPTFEKHVTVAKHLGLLLLRLIDSPIIPLNTTHYALELKKYLADVEEIASSLGLSPDFARLHEAMDHVKLGSDVLDRYKRDAEESLDRTLREQPCYNRRGASCWLAKLLDRLLGSPKRRRLFWATWHVRQANERLMRFERGFISEDGLEGREWYRHLGVAPGKWLGYGATTLPAVTEALTIERNVTLAEEEAGRLASLLEDLAHRLVNGWS
ncbi:Zn-dependent exopeptidase [Trametes polyzona]|nr:Zn-dependent exopeptidase [Trametes polyzona]